MKKLLLICLLGGVSSLLFAQNDKIFDNNNTSEVSQEKFDRKGRILLEIGYNTIGGSPFGNSTGFILVTDNSGSVSGMGLNVGYFTSQNFALKLAYSTINYDDFKRSTYQVGGKYYIAGKVPIEALIGAIKVIDNNEKLGSIVIGYAIPLAENINLEPSLGILNAYEESSTIFKLSFAMFL